MLFHVTQTHTPGTCPKNEGSSKALYNSNVEGVKLKAIYGAFADHIIYYIVEADGLNAIRRFLDPSWTRCMCCAVIPVREAPVVR